MSAEPIGVLGAGWVGPATATGFADLGHHVTVRDVVPERVAALSAGAVPIHEAGLAQLLAQNRERLQFTLELDDVLESASINEIANVCELVGADIDDVARGIGLDRRLGPHFLRAGIGYGGSCFPKDASALKQLAANSGYHFQLLASVIEVNELLKRRVVQKLQDQLGSLHGKTVALLGLTFKPHTNDMREAPSLVLGSRLLAEGAVVRAWDPVAREVAKHLPDGVELADTLLEAVEGADAALVVTEWPELSELVCSDVREAMRTPLIVDGRNMLDPAAVRAAGFAYEAIGRRSAVADDRNRARLRS